jgi:hypothetical protein
MSRHDVRVRQQYTEIFDPNLPKNGCFYCGKMATTEDYTPSPKGDFESYEGEWVVTRCCNSCKTKIYYRNYVKAGEGYGVNIGCMSVADKLNLIGHSVKKKMRLEAVQADRVTQFYVEEIYQVYLPKGSQVLMNESELDIYAVIYSNESYSLKEVFAMQALIMAYLHKMPQETIDRIFSVLLLVEPRKEAYMRFAGIVQ